MVVMLLPWGTIPCMRPRLEFISPMMSPVKSSGTVIATRIMGSSSVGDACCTPFVSAWLPAISKHMPEESTVW